VYTYDPAGNLPQTTDTVYPLWNVTVTVPLTGQQLTVVQGRVVIAMDIQATKGFWAALRTQAAALREAAFSGQLPHAHHQVKQLLHDHGIEVVMEMTTDGGDTVLVFTPEWSFSRARLIDQLAALAPEIPGWQIHGRRHRKNWATAFALLEAAFGVGAEDARFTIDTLEEGLSVTMYSSAVNEIDLCFHETFVFYLLSHALGEEVLFDKIATAILAPPDHAGQTLSKEDLATAVENCKPFPR
jgi:hypothetical protein